MVIIWEGRYWKKNAVKCTKFTATDFPERYELKIAKKDVLVGEKLRKAILIEKSSKMYYLTSILRIFLKQSLKKKKVVGAGEYLRQALPVEKSYEMFNLDLLQLILL